MLSGRLLFLNGYCCSRLKHACGWLRSQSLLKARLLRVYSLSSEPGLSPGQSIPSLDALDEMAADDDEVSSSPSTPSKGQVSRSVSTDRLFSARGLTAQSSVGLNPEFHRCINEHPVCLSALYPLPSNLMFFGCAVQPEPESHTAHCNPEGV